MILAVCFQLKQLKNRSDFHIFIYMYINYHRVYDELTIDHLSMWLDSSGDREFLNSVEIAFFLFSLFSLTFLFSFYVCICASVFLLTCNLIYFYLMLMSTGCLAPLAPTVIPGMQYSNFYL